jgi:hypothetical protein
MMWPGTIEATTFGWAYEALAIHSVATWRTGKLSAFEAITVWTVGVAISLEAPMFAPACEAFAFKTSTARAFESFTFEFAAAWTGETITFKSRTLGTTRVTFSFEPTALRRTGETFAIVTAPRRWTVEAAALVATAFGATSVTTIFTSSVFESRSHRWTWRPAPLESCVSVGATRSATFESRTVRTSRSAGPLPVLADGFRHLHEFVFAEFAVVVFVELLKHLRWVRRLWTAAAFWATSAGGTRTTFAGFLPAASTAHVEHFFAGFAAFFSI